MKKKILSVLLCTMMACVTFAGCGNQDSGQQKNAQISNEGSDSKEQGDDQQNSPALATDWEWVDDKHLKMNLRDDVKATDGTPFTANDVLFSLKTTEEQGSGIAIYFDLAETTVESDTCIIPGLKQADNGFLFLLGNAEFSLISESATEAAGGIDKAIYN